MEPMSHLNTLPRLPATSMTGCTSESLPDPADELLAQGQLTQTLGPGLTDVLQQLAGMDKLLADPLQLLMAIHIKVVSLQDRALLWAGPGYLEPWSPSSGTDHPKDPVPLFLDLQQLKAGARSS